MTKKEEELSELAPSAPDSIPSKTVSLPHAPYPRRLRGTLRVLSGGKWDARTPRNADTRLDPTQQSRRTHNSPRGVSVETEREFVKVVVKMPSTDSTLMSSPPPSVEQRCNSVTARQLLRRPFAHVLLGVAGVGRHIDTLPRIFINRYNSLLDGLVAVSANAETVSVSSQKSSTSA